MAWGIETIVDDELEANEVVYMESGDHERLLRVSHDQFHALMLTARHGHFCGDPTH
jgi:Ala-tRNA(Pro) deacylase